MEHSRDVNDVLQQLRDRDKKVRTTTYLLTFIPAIAAVILLGLTYKEIKLAKTEITQLENKKIKLTHEIDSINKATKLADSLALFGLSKAKIATYTKADFNEISELNKQIKAYKSKVDPSITLKYFPKLNSEDKAMADLKKLGYQFEILNPKPSMLKTATNSIWIGSEVNRNKIENVKIVAFYLMRAGIKIKAIRLFREPNGAKANLIEVGADKTIPSYKEWSIEDIIKAQSFDRNGTPR